MLAIAGYLLSVVIKENKHIERCTKWPLITARVTRKTVVEISSFAGVRGFAKISFYIPDIDYIFNINGKDFEGHARLRREWTPVLPLEISAAKGQTVQVHYNPENPVENTPGLEKPHLIDEIYRIILLILVALGIVLILIFT
jgi:hypothetical protein